MIMSGQLKKQEGYQNKDATPPTVQVESVHITSAIDTHERRDVDVFDIPGAFLTADMDEDVII